VAGKGLSTRHAFFYYRILTRVIAGYVNHPNVGGAILIGLGCETNQIPALMQAHGLRAGPTLRTLTMQETGGTRAAVEAAIAAIRGMLPIVSAAIFDYVLAVASGEHPVSEQHDYGHNEFVPW
jgi:altronate dehydratase